MAAKHDGHNEMCSLCPLYCHMYKLQFLFSLCPWNIISFVIRLICQVCKADLMMLLLLALCWDKINYLAQWGETTWVLGTFFSFLLRHSACGIYSSMIHWLNVHSCQHRVVKVCTSRYDSSFMPAADSVLSEWGKGQACFWMIDWMREGEWEGGGGGGTERADVITSGFFFWLFLYVGV